MAGHSRQRWPGLGTSIVLLVVGLDKPECVGGTVVPDHSNNYSSIVDTCYMHKYDYQVM